MQLESSFASVLSLVADKRIGASRKIWLGAAGATAVITVTAVVSHYLGRYQPFADLIHESQSGPYANLSVVIDDAVISHHLSANEQLTIKASHVELSRDRRLITATHIYDSYIARPSGRKIVSFSAGSASVLANSGLAGGAFQGSVRIDNGVQASSTQFPQPEINCSRLIWDSQMETVNCPGTLTVSLPGYKTTVTGQDLGYDIRTGNLHVSHIHGVFHLKDAVQ